MADIDVSPATSQPDVPVTAKPEGCELVALVLQGGGALGAYQAGVYEALHEAGLEPDWVAGVSIGAVNAAIIAGNSVAHRLPRLRAFWEQITQRRVWPFTPDGDEARKMRNLWSASMTVNQGQPGFFEPNRPGPLFSARGSQQATAFYDTAPLRETLLRLVDFERLNRCGTRFAVGAVNVMTGNFAFFDSAETTIGPEHIMASGALPPGLPMVRVGHDWFWDGGLVSNTPLQHLLDRVGPMNSLVFQVDLFSARGPLPRDIHDVLGRQKDIQYSSRTRLTTDRYHEQYRMRAQLRRLYDRVPDDQLDGVELEEKRALERLPQLVILQIIYQQAAYETQLKDCEFSGTSMREHWDAGLRDTRRTLSRRDWLRMPSPELGIVLHDVHRAED